MALQKLYALVSCMLCAVALILTLKALCTLLAEASDLTAGCATHASLRCALPIAVLCLRRLLCTMRAHLLQTLRM